MVERVPVVGEITDKIDYILSKAAMETFVAHPKMFSYSHLLSDELLNILRTRPEFGSLCVNVVSL